MGAQDRHIYGVGCPSENKQHSEISGHYAPFTSQLYPMILEYTTLIIHHLAATTFSSDILIKKLLFFCEARSNGVCLLLEERYYFICLWFQYFSLNAKLETRIKSCFLSHTYCYHSAVYILGLPTFCFLVVKNSHSQICRI